MSIVKNEYFHIVGWNIVINIGILGSFLDQVMTKLTHVDSLVNFRNTIVTANVNVR